MFRIFGPPGTGKTTQLLNMVDRQLEAGVQPTNIAFLAFTRKAAEEARERAAARFNLDPKQDLFFFKTLHSLALSMTDIRTDQVMQPEHYRELGNAIGVSLHSEKTNRFSDIPETQKSSDPVLGLINLAILRKVPLRTQYNISRIDESWNVVKYVDEALTKYKKSYNLYDFTDMLRVFAETGESCCPRFAVTFLDEAQDLSPLQWDIAHMLDRRSEKMYCAGDDDQAIYRWAGADVEHFIGLEGGSETLSQSYRVPKLPWGVAQNIARRIHRRFPKTYKPREEKGFVTRISMINELDLSEGSWLILAQAAYLLQDVSSDLKAMGLLFTFRGHRSVSERMSEAINGWEQLRKDKEISGRAVKSIYSYMSSKDRIKRGFKRLGGLEEDQMFSFDVLVKDYGLLATKDMIWHVAMDKMPETDRAYIIAMLRRGEKFNAPPRITVSTIHGSKGGEADNVILFTDLSPAADESMRLEPDDMHRTFYVAVTRTKQNLFIVEPEDISRSYDL